MVDIQEKDLQTLYLAGGCFWGLERYFQQVSGVRATHVGYAQSQVENPTYEEVCSGDTDAVETVEIIFDPHAVSLRTLVLLFLDVIDPYLLNRQGNDRGRQYRTGLYWPAAHEEDQEPVFRQALDELAQRESQTPVVEVGELKNFYLAEESHQNYLQKHPDGYCHISSEKISEVAQRQRFIEQIWALDSQQYRVTQEADTERPFENAYDSNFRPGLYVDRVSGQPLFLSTDKFDAGCGWPSFAKPIDPQAITTRKDFKLFGQPRIEVKTAASGSHLGHVFTDGPKELGGLRYCMNSAALRFIPKEDMVAQGYGQYLPMLDE